MQGEEALEDDDGVLIDAALFQIIQQLTNNVVEAGDHLMVADMVLFCIDFVFRVCMNDHMKTITLDEDAYERLKSWKRMRGDSFSAVVKRVVPRAGTLEAMASFAIERAASVKGRDELLESTIESRSAAKHDPWT